MKQIILLTLTSFLLTGCVTKMIGGAVSVATFGLVKNDKTQETVQQQINKNQAKEV